MNFETLKVIGYTLLVLGAYSLGYHNANVKAEKEKAEMLAEQAQLTAQFEEQARAQEQEAQKKADTAAESARRQTDEIQKRFDNFVTLRDFDFNSGVRTDTASAEDHSKQVSDNAAVTLGVSDCDCKRIRANRSKLQRFYERQMTIARDCDITSSHYNELIKMWNEVSNGNRSD